MKYLFLVLILFLPSQLGKHWWPEWSLVSGVRVDYLSPTVYLSDLMLFLLILTFLFQNRKIFNFQFSIFNQIPNSNFQKIKPKFIFYVLTASYLLFIIFSSPRHWLGIYWLARYLEIPLVAFLIIKMRRIRGERRIRREIIIALAIAVLFSVGLGAAQMILGRTTGWFWWLGERTFTAATPGVATMTILGREVLRPYATFGHPNALGGFLAAAIMILLGKREEGRGKKVLIFIGVLGVILTGSRGAILGLIIAKLLNCYIVSEIRRVKNWGLLGIVIVSSLVIGYRWNNTNKLVIFANESSTERNILNHAAIKMWRESWLTGVGPGQFLAKLPDYLPDGFWKIQPVHNVFLLVLAEFGIIGLSIIIITIIKVIKSAVGAKSAGLIIITIIKVIKSAIGAGGAGLKWLPVLTVIFVTGMVDHYWLTAQQNRLLLGVILGLMISAWGRRSIGDSGLRPRNR